MDRYDLPHIQLDCPHRVVCHCLGVTEAELIDALDTYEITTLKEIRQHTGAGDGCTCCHRQLKQYLEDHAQSPCPSSSSALPICSVK